MPGTEHNGNVLRIFSNYHLDQVENRKTGYFKVESFTVTKLAELKCEE